MGYKIDRLQDLPGRRGFRLVILGLLIALVYPEARLLWVLLLALGYFWPFVDGLLVAWRRESVWAGWTYARSRMPFLPFVLGFTMLLVAFFIFAQWDLYCNRLAFDRFKKNDLRGPFSFERDRPYRGRSWGLRGPIVVDLRFRDNVIYDDPATRHKVEGIEVVENSDSLSVGREAMDEMARRIRDATVTGGNIAELDGISGATYSSLGLRNAVIDAIYREKAGSGLSWPSRLIFSLTGNDISRFVFSASAVIFIIGLLFEFCLGPFLKKDAGVTLPCYNCQTCVGVCPVKLVEDVPYPMTMVLETRVGNYERAAELARYCVGCSRCAGRCPVGISGPMVASKAIAMARERRDRDEVPSVGDGTSGADCRAGDGEVSDERS